MERDAHQRRRRWRGSEAEATPGQDILKFGTGELDRTLLQHNLIDEFHLWLFPVVAGSGQRLFDGIDATLKLADATTFSTGIVAFTYTPR